MLHRRTRTHGFTLVELLTVCLIIALLAAIIIPQFWRAYHRSNYTACMANLKNLSTEVHGYAADHDHNYPAVLTDIVPNYFNAIPTCPSAGTDTYTASYQVSNPDNTFTIFCKGSNHLQTGKAADQPWVHSDEGVGPD